MKYNRFISHKEARELFDGLSLWFQEKELILLHTAAQIVGPQTVKRWREEGPGRKLCHRSYKGSGVTLFMIDMPAWYSLVEYANTAELEALAEGLSRERVDHISLAVEDAVLDLGDRGLLPAGFEYELLNGDTCCV